MNALSTDAFTFPVPARNVVECGRCGTLVRGKIVGPYQLQGRGSPAVELLSFTCECSPNASMGIVLSPEGVPIFHIPR